MKRKFGFVLAPSTRLTGALEINRDIYNYLKNELNVESIIADTDYYYGIPVIGSLLNYFTNYSKADSFETIMGTSFATLPFLQKSRIIQHFHGVDTAGYNNVIKSIDSQTEKENIIMNKWLSRFGELIYEDANAISSKLEIAKTVERICSISAELIIVVSPATKKHVEEYFDIDENKIKVILNGIPDFWFVNDAKTYQNTEPTVTFTTRANSSAYTYLEKGHDRGYEILSSVSNNKNIFLFMNQTEENYCKKYLSVVRNNTNANIYQNLSRRDIKSKYQAYDIQILTSRTEACQLTLIEAMASKMVPISFPVGIAPDYIENGINGFLINSIAEGVEIINKLSKSHDLRRSIGEEAYKTAFKHFRYGQMLDKYYQTINEYL